LERDLRALSRGFRLWIDDDYAFVIIVDLVLPPGYGQSHTAMLLELPDDYPLSPLGVGESHVFLPPSLRFRGRRISDLHDWQTPSVDTPGFGPWAWFCYERVRWSPERDDLIRFVEMVRADLANPRTCLLPLI
jgi:hypothetical protein